MHYGSRYVCEYGRGRTGAGPWYDAHSPYWLSETFLHSGTGYWRHHYLAAGAGGVLHLWRRVSHGWVCEGFVHDALLYVCWLPVRLQGSEKGRKSPSGSDWSCGRSHYYAKRHFHWNCPWNGPKRHSGHGRGLHSHEWWPRNCGRIRTSFGADGPYGGTVHCHGSGDLRPGGWIPAWRTAWRGPDSAECPCRTRFYSGRSFPKPGDYRVPRSR